MGSNMEFVLLVLVTETVVGFTLLVKLIAEVDDL